MARGSAWLARADASTMLMLLAVCFLAVAAITLSRTRGGRLGDTWAPFTLAIALVIGATLQFPGTAGYFAIAIVLVVLVVPVRLDQAAVRAWQRDELRRARQLALVARVLRPFGSVARRVSVFSALEALGRGAKLDEEMFLRLGVANQPTGREVYRVVALLIDGDLAGVRNAFALPHARATLLNEGLGASLMRAIGDLGRPNDVADALVEIERHDPTISDPERRALVALEAAAAVGDLAATQRIVESLGRNLRPDAASRLVATAYAARGEWKEADAVLERRLANRHADDPPSRSLSKFRDRIAARQAARVPRPLPAEAAATLDRWFAEVAATNALTPLHDGPKTRTPVTYATALILILVFLMQLELGAPDRFANLVMAGGLVVPLTRVDQSWRLLTSSMLHGGWMHLVFNVVALIGLGRFVETSLGRARWIAIYVLSAIGSGAAVSVLADSAHPRVLVGASGAIFGLAGAILSTIALRADLRGTRRGRDELKNLAMLCVFQMAIDHAVPQISGTAHIAGLMCGLLLGALLRRPAPQAPISRREPTTRPRV